jgi:glycosyltransferase involved in cell wall biosynthesis
MPSDERRPAFPAAGAGTRDCHMRVAIVHYWLVGMRGGEKVVEALCEMFPQADIFTNAYRPQRISERIKRHSIRTTFVGKLPYAWRLYKKYLPLMPLALEQLDLRDYDLVISSESGPAKGVITRPDALHLCYCHTPMRYAWSMYFDYLKHANPAVRIVMPWLIHWLRVWDCQSAARVDFFVANSHGIARQIAKYYRREAVVVHPPVDVESFSPSAERGRYYLCAGQLVRYKRFDLAIEACNRRQAPLVIIGAGEELRALQRIAGPTITFLGRQDAGSLRHFYARCRALIFPGEEDFGIVPIEVMASGRPVIAFGRGGARETVIPGQTGVFFDEQTPAAVARAIEEFEAIEDSFEPGRLVQHTAGYSTKNFKRQMVAALRQAAEAADFNLSLGDLEAGAVVPFEAAREPSRALPAADHEAGRWRA